MRRSRLASVPLFAVALIANGALVAGAIAAHAGQPRALLELFTSQGCSSCPEADKLIGELADDPDFVAVSLPIDYWDYLGWKDTLASPADSARQRAYAHARGDREVYTPQVVVNGSTHVLGSDRAAIERAVAQTGRNALVMSVPIALTANGRELKVKIAAADKAHAGEIWLATLARALPVAIGRGENRGRMVTYHNVVRHWVKLGDYTGAEMTFSVPLAEFRSGEVDAAAIVVQQGSHDKPGIALGAAWVPLGAQTTDNSDHATQSR
jgi:hypothetical protein